MSKSLSLTSNQILVLESTLALKSDTYYYLIQNFEALLLLLSKIDKHFICLFHTVCTGLEAIGVVGTERSLLFSIFLAVFMSFELFCVFESFTEHSLESFEANEVMAFVRIIFGVRYVFDGIFPLNLSMKRLSL